MEVPFYGGAKAPPTFAGVDTRLVPWLAGLVLFALIIGAAGGFVPSLIAFAVVGIVWALARAIASHEPAFFDELLHAAALRWGKPPVMPDDGSIYEAPEPLIARARRALGLSVSVDAGWKGWRS